MSQFTTDEANPHLGGACVGGDSATFFPELWTWLVEEYQVRSVIDVGCGEGHAVDFFWKAGCERILGLDGIEQSHPHVITHDFTTGRWPYWGKRHGDVIQAGYYDLCWSCEFVEHVEERYVPNFLATFALADLVLMTHAEPGQLGYHHVNCRTADYWKGALASIGYQFDETLTAATRELARSNTDPNNHYVRSGLAFRKYE